MFCLPYHRACSICKAVLGRDKFLCKQERIKSLYVEQKTPQLRPRLSTLTIVNCFTLPFFTAENSIMATVQLINKDIFSTCLSE